MPAFGQCTPDPEPADVTIMDGLKWEGATNTSKFNLSLQNEHSSTIYIISIITEALCLVTHVQPLKALFQ